MFNRYGNASLLVTKINFDNFIFNCFNGVILNYKIGSELNPVLKTVNILSSWQSNSYEQNQVRYLFY